ncbi:proteasome activator pa28 REG alpha/beta subunit [Cyathus striatus]|nr:proteasome activator pa28 REG alpha/beta subunit [Cyathus striatus]
MEQNIEHKIEEFKKNASKAGEDIVFRTFPGKVLELGEVIRSAKLPDSPFNTVHAQTSTDVTIYPPPSMPVSVDDMPTKKRKASSGEADISARTSDVHSVRFTNVVLANHHISNNIHNIIKKESEQLIESVDEVKLWVTLTMPKIEDGDNFGVQIQEEVLGELHRAQESAYNLRDAARQNHLARAKLCSKLLKYPHVEDYTLALREHDEKQLYLARQHLSDIRNMYAVLTDLIHKNISKIRAPKANNSVGLY